MKSKDKYQTCNNSKMTKLHVSRAGEYDISKRYLWEFIKLYRFAFFRN